MTVMNGMTRITAQDEDEDEDEWHEYDDWPWGDWHDKDD